MNGRKAELGELCVDLLQAEHSAVDLADVEYALVESLRDLVDGLITEVDDERKAEVKAWKDERLEEVYSNRMREIEDALESKHLPRRRKCSGRSVLDEVELGVQRDAE